MRIQTIHILLAVAFLFFPAFAVAQTTSLSLHVEEAGTLSTLLGDNSQTVENLILSGELNEEDITTMRNLVEEQKLMDINLEKVQIDDNLVRFDWLSQLRSMVLPENMDSIAEEAFSGCSSLESIILPNSLKVIGERAFSGNEALQTIDFPETLTKIGDQAFEYTTSLTSVFLPKSLGRIESYGIFFYSGIVSATLDEGITATGPNLFFSCAYLESVSLPNSLTKIDGQAFFGTESLSTITIPENVDSIGAYAFMSTGSLRTVYSKNPVPPVLEGTFSWEPKEMGMLIIPEGSLLAYKTAYEWEDFKYIQEEIVTGIDDDEITSNNVVTGGVGKISVELEKYARIEVYTITGVRSFSSSLGAGEHLLPLHKGIYLVKIDNETSKVIVK